MHPTIDDKKVKELIASFPDPQYDVPAPNSCRHKYYPEIAFIGAREPPRIIYPDPTIAQCVRHFEAYELGLIAITTAYTSYVGYQNAGPRKNL